MRGTMHQPTSGTHDRFISLRQIGAGGMGIVHAAIDTQTGRRVALKTARVGRGGRRRGDQQLRREAAALALVTNPHVCRFYELVNDDGRACLVLERLEGESLQWHLARSRASNQKLLDVAVQVTTALAAIHAAGLVHQDLKPANIFLTDSGVVKVLDFGLAVPIGVPSDGAAAGQAHSRPTLMGSPNYLSPERVMRRSADPRSDLFSLGIVLYEMATGLPPFASDTPFEMLLNVLEARPVPVRELAPDRPAALAALVHKLLARHMKDRCQSAREMLRQLRALRRPAAATVGGRRAAVAA
jgi:eukaryotic-like serine/threonine-protein kinase